MNCEEYMKEADKTAPEFSKNLLDTTTEVLKMNAKNSTVLNAILGLVGEAAEIQDAYKKMVFQGHSFNKEKIIDELGDVFWYAALLCKALDTDFESVFAYNIQKLRKRYGDHFEASKSINREEYVNK